MTRPPEPPLFLVNPASGNGATGKRWPKLRKRAAELGLEGEQVLSEFPGHLAQAAKDSPGSLLVVIGGDGTVNEVANGVAGTEAELAVLPCGTGQDFGRTHGLPTRFDDAVRVALGGETRTIDLGRVELESGTSRFFANVGSAGMSGAVARRANTMTKAFGGRATFFYALTREFLAWQNTRVVVELDDGVQREGPMHDVIVANGNWHGGGMKLAPDARQDDGVFDVVHARSRERGADRLARRRIDGTETPGRFRSGAPCTCDQHLFHVALLQNDHTVGRVAIAWSITFNAASRSAPCTTRRGARTRSLPRPTRSCISLISCTNFGTVSMRSSGSSHA